MDENLKSICAFCAFMICTLIENNYVLSQIYIQSALVISTSVINYIVHL